jgi:hypothetical protein
MSTPSFVPLPGLANRRALWALSNWLPQREQILSAVQLRVHEVIGATGAEQENEADVRTTSMRQALGLVVITALAAGLLPFVVNWLVATQAGTALPLVQLAQSVAQQSERWAASPLPFDVWTETANTLAGLDPIAPGWLAALLSALGEWVNWPLSWLTFWLVYGLGILVVAKLLGAGTTLQRFYAATGYAYVPLLLTGLSPIPCLGALASLAGLVWTFMVYVQAVEVVTQLGRGKAALCVLLPGALVLLLGMLVLFTLTLLAVSVAV